MLALAFGIFLSGAAPSWAMPGMADDSSAPANMQMMMPAMAMHIDCAGMVDNRAPNKGTPCKSMDAGCALCAACALTVGLLLDSSPIQALVRGQQLVFTQDVNRNGIAVLPALPPPILHA